jgi:hypothetical protein
MAAALIFKNTDLERNLRSASEQVLQRFKLPSLRLLCFFDDESPQQFDAFMGSQHCGFHTPVMGSGNLWPTYVDDLFIDSMGNFVSDNAIYLNGRTTVSVPGTVITLAHELQHFMQYANAWKVWRANTLITNILRDGPPTTIKSWDIPFEKDTTRVSKRVAEEILGADAIKAHTDAQIALGNHAEKWKFFRDVPYSTPFDLLAETKPWVEKYRTELLRIPQSDIDFNLSEWWKSS